MSLTSIGAPSRASTRPASTAPGPVTPRAPRPRRLSPLEFGVSGYPRPAQAHRFGGGVLPELRRRGLLAAPR